MEEFGTVVAVVSFLKPVLIDFLKSIWISKIQNEQVYKSVLSLVTFVVGVIICIAINLIGNYGMDTIQVIMIGGGISYTAGQISYRTAKTTKELRHK